MNDTPERGAPQRLGRFGRAVNPYGGYALGGVIIAGVLAFSLWRSNSEGTAPLLSPAGGQTTIASTGQVRFASDAANSTPSPGNTSPPPGIPQTSGNVVTVLQPRGVVSFGTVAAREPPRGASAAGTETTMPAADSGQQRPAATGVNFAAAQMPGLRAGAPIDQALTLMPGFYSMVLDTPINSERCGTFFAHVAKPWKSREGVILMDAGTTIQGRCSSQVSQGQERVVLAMAWAMTPEGVPVPLGGADGADGSGRAGVPGELNTHFWPRMGSALTLLLTQGSIQLATSYLQAQASRGGGNNTFLNINTSGIERVLAETMRANGGIQNTVDIAAGTEIGLLLPTPISFADAFRLAPTSGAPSR